MRPWHRRPCPVSSDAQARGDFGERAAACFLRERGYRVLARRFAAAGGEIDIVCRRGEILVFVEVRARSREDFGRPAETVTAPKRRRLSKAALAYLALLGNPRVHFRFDIAEVFLTPGAPPELDVTVNAFDLAEPYLY